MERCLGAGGLPSGAATLNLPVASAVATTTAGVSGNLIGSGLGGLGLHPFRNIINKRHYY